LKICTKLPYFRTNFLKNSWYFWQKKMKNL